MLKFSKMHGLGNDFIVIDAINQSVELTASQIQFLADRHLGIGCDQLLLVESPSHPQHDFKYRIFNADGSEVQQCGNGVRCFARFVHNKGLTSKTSIAVETAAGIVYPSLQAQQQVQVAMGKPRFAPTEIPFISPQRALTYQLNLADGSHQEISVVSMGNPHAVILVDDVATAPVAAIGAEIEQHPQFPERVNVGFMQVIDPHHIRLRVFERGVGETRACGTGACAAVVCGIQRGLLTTPVTVALTGGELTISWAQAEASVLMTGAALAVFDGEIAWTTINNH